MRVCQSQHFANRVYGSLGYILHNPSFRLFFFSSRLPLALLLLLLLDACAFFVWFVMSVRFGGAWIREIHADITTEPYSLHWIPNCIRLLQTHPLAYIPFNERTEISVWQIHRLYICIYMWMVMDMTQYVQYWIVPLVASVAECLGFSYGVRINFCQH